MSEGQCNFQISRAHEFAVLSASKYIHVQVNIHVSQVYAYDSHKWNSLDYFRATWASEIKVQMKTQVNYTIWLVLHSFLSWLIASWILWFMVDITYQDAWGL